MGPKRLKKLISQDSDLNRFQSNVEEAVNPLINAEIVNGVLLKDIYMDAETVTLVQHKLGRKVRGWVVVRLRADARIWDVQDSNSNPTTTLALVASHAVTVDVWVF